MGFSPISRHGDGLVHRQETRSPELKTTAMKTLINTLMIAGALIVTQAPVQANEFNAPGNEKGPVMRKDKVGADLNTAADPKSAKIYDRTVTMAPNGMYDVEVRDDNGGIRMTGTYADADLKVAEGEFTFYYSNGNIESKGMYANGMKTGTWLRYDMDGSAKAERNYTGKSWEDMAVELGMASKTGSN
jgi:hypothetical protein